MDLQILLLLGQDGITNGAIYALLALALVLVFAVTRVIFIPQGEFVAFGALTLASLQAGKVPGTVWLLLGLGTAVALLDGYRLVRDGRYTKLPTLLITNIALEMAGRQKGDYAFLSPIDHTNRSQSTNDVYPTAFRLALLMRLESDLLEIMDACIDGRLDEVKLSIRPESALGVVIAAEGYPGSYLKGMEIKGIDAVDALPDTKVFQAGTKREGSRTLSSGGRVLCVTALGKGLAEAQKRAYEAVAKIDMEKSQHRSDIGAKGLRRL